MSLLVLFSRRWCDLGGVAVYTGRWLAKEKTEEVKQLAKRQPKGKRKEAKDLKTELLKQAVEAVKEHDIKIDAPAVTLDDLENAIKAMELIERNIKHIYDKKAAKEYQLELERLRAEQARLIRQEELENELITFLLTM